MKITFEIEYPESSHPITAEYIEKCLRLCYLGDTEHGFVNVTEVKAEEENH